MTDRYTRRRDRIESEVREVHARRNDAWRSRDGATYLSFYAEDATIFLAQRLHTRDRMVERVTTMLAAGGGAMAMDAGPPDDILLGPGGDVAVTTSTWTQRLRNADGGEVDLVSFETDV
jgi:ketosteroid isomerase-like protein